MTESSSESVSELPTTIDKNGSSDCYYDNNNSNSVAEIPIDVVSEEEMGLLEAALASARSSVTSSARLPPAAIRSSSHVHSNNVRSIRSITLLSKRGLADEARDIEDCGGDFIRRRTAQKQKKARPPDSFFLRFKKKTGLSVTDVTATVLDIYGFMLNFPKRVSSICCSILKISCCFCYGLKVGIYINMSFPNGF